MPIPPGLGIEPANERAAQQSGYKILQSGKMHETIAA
jgi:hypothetical protein